MKRFIIFVAGILLMSQAQGMEYHLTGGGQAKITLKRKAKVLQKTKGRVALNLVSSQKELNRGVLSVRDLNVMAFGVRQDLLSKRRPKGKLTSGLGFQIDLGKSLPQLKYSENKKAFTGNMRGRVDYAQLSELQKIKYQVKQDAYPTPQLPGQAAVSLVTNAEWWATANKCGPFQFISTMQITLPVLGGYGVEGFEIIIEVPRVEIHWGCTQKFVSWRELCLQPVSIRNNNSDSDPTGDGWAFGMPGAEAQWQKANVLFKKRPFTTITESALKVTSEAEMDTLRAKVQSDDCVEVYFSERFSPQTLFGGGATFGVGSASAQIVTSDENADMGVDLTHLAHELGHAMALHHPNAGFPTQNFPNIFDGSSGTLMCGSGFNNDNPTDNSVENGDNLSNPLFTFKLLRNEGTQMDCADSADCGACP